MSDAIPDTFEYDTKVLPRDLEPGDKIDRVDRNLDVVTATIKEVKKVRRFERTVYKVYLVEADQVPETQQGWAEHRHLSPFILRPTQKVQVTRTASTKGLI